MKNNHGIPMTSEGLKEYEQTWIDIEESIELVMKYGEDLESISQQFPQQHQPNIPKVLWYIPDCLLPDCNTLPIRNRHHFPVDLALVLRVLVEVSFDSAVCLCSLSLLSAADLRA